MSEGYIQQYIPETEVFSAEAGKFPRAALRCPKARHAARDIFSDSDEKQLSKSPKNDFLATKIFKSWVPILAKVIIIWVYFGSKSSSIASKVLKPF